jgi:hypothetical protein
MGILAQLFELGLFLLFPQCSLVSTSGLSLENIPLRYNDNRQCCHEHDVVDHFSKSIPLHPGLCISLLWILAWCIVSLELVQPSVCGTSNLQLGQGTVTILFSVFRWTGRVCGGECHVPLLVPCGLLNYKYPFVLCFLFRIGLAQCLLHNIGYSPMDRRGSGLYLLLQDGSIIVILDDNHHHGHYLFRHLVFAHSSHAGICLLFWPSSDPCSVSISLHSCGASSEYRH